MAAKGYSARIRNVIEAMSTEFTGKDIARKLKIKYTRVNAALYYLEKTDKIRPVTTVKTGKRGRPRKVFIKNTGKNLPIVVE